MRVRIIWFLFGAIVALWVNAYTAEMENSNWWRALSPSTIEFNHDAIEDALEPVAQDGDEEEEPAPTWLYEKTPAHKLA